jgi:hypothetical protein
VVDVGAEAGPVLAKVSGVDVALRDDPAGRCGLSPAGEPWIAVRRLESLPSRQRSTRSRARPAAARTLTLDLLDVLKEAEFLADFNIDPLAAQTGFRRR